MPQTPEEIVVFFIALLLLCIALGIMVILLIKLGIYVKKLDKKKDVAFQNHVASEDEELNSILSDWDIE